MSKKRIYDQKHLTTSQRIHIENGLSFAAIARKLEKHPSTIAKEVKKYRTFQKHEVDKSHPLRCARFKECSLRFLCDKPNCVKVCKYCYNNSLRTPVCTTLCPEYLEPQCPSISKAPFVCNNCAKSRKIKHSILLRMQISPHRNYSYLAGKALIKMLLTSLCLMTLFLHCSLRGSLSLTFMPFTGMRFLVPERRSTII